MAEYIELISVPVIVGIVYAVIEAIKKAVNSNETFLRFVPLVSLVLGVICGIVAYYAVPGYIEASNVWVALLIGGASGLSATGTNQIFKQLTQGDEDDE